MRAIANALGSTEREMELWRHRVDRNGAKWREDQRHRQYKDGALYYIGGEFGQYMRIAKDGSLRVGDYELARPNIEEAVFAIRAMKQYGSYKQAACAAYQLAGTRFTDEIWNGKPSVMDQIREERKAPPAPHKHNDTPAKDGPEQNKHKGGSEL